MLKHKPLPIITANEKLVDIIKNQKAFITFEFGNIIIDYITKRVYVSIISSYNKKDEDAPTYIQGVPFVSLEFNEIDEDIFSAPKVNFLEYAFRLGLQKMVEGGVLGLIKEDLISIY
jgi:hypothetical protein